MERKLGRKFAKLTKEEVKLIEKLRQNANAMIKGKISKKNWNSILKQYERYIKQRKETGVFYVHRTLKAVDEAAKWYLYQKQLYNLRKREPQEQKIGKKHENGRVVEVRPHLS